MPRRGKRTRLAPAIYRDGSGIAARVNIGDWRKEKRFPPDTPLDLIQDWQDRERERLSHYGRSDTANRGTLAADVETYLDLVKHLASWVSLRAELRAWVERFPQSSRYAINQRDILQARADWLHAGYSPKTVNNRVVALARLFRRLDGKRARTPCDDIALLPVHKTPPIVISNAVVRKVYAELLAWEKTGRLRDAKTRARFMVIASTGKRPSEVARAEPDDVDLKRRVWVVRDGKGGWSPGVYLNDEMLVAWRVFAQAKAWGAFRESAWVKTLRAAGWPAGIRPYNLRHTVGLTMSESGADLADIQQHLGHKRIETTRRHYVPVLHSRLQQVSELLDGRFGWARATRRATPRQTRAEFNGHFDRQPARSLSPDRKKPGRKTR